MSQYKNLLSQWSILQGKHLFLLILPGILIVLQVNGLWLAGGIAVFPLLFLLIFILNVVDVVRVGRLEPRHLPVIGATIYQIRNLMIWQFNTHGTAALFDLLLSVFTVIGLFIVIRSRPKISPFAWTVFLLLLLVLGLGVINLTDRWLSIFVLWLIDWIKRTVPFFAIGLLLSKRHGVSSALILITNIPLLLDMYLLPDGISYEVWHASDSHVQLAWMAYRLLGLFSFFILIPIISLAIKDKYKQANWLGGSSLITIAGLVILWIAFLQDPGNVYRFSQNFLLLFFTLILWTPIVFGLIVFNDYRKNLIDTEKLAK